MKHKLTVEQRQLLSQNQISSLELLALCNSDLYQYMENEYMENPLLEHTNTDAESYTQEDDQAWYRSNYSRPSENTAGFYEEVSGEGSLAMEALNTENIYSCIYEQLELDRYSDQHLQVIDYLIQSLDSNGYIDLEVSEIAQLTGVKEEIIESCLLDLKKLEPDGIFAKNLAECLLIQIERLGLDDANLKHIISHHLTDISQGKLSSITRELDISSEQARRYVALISTLNPRPLQGFGLSEKQYIIPDVIVTMEPDGKWYIEINDNWCGNYQLNDYYLQMMAEAKDPEIFEYFKKKLERARFLIHAVEQRRKTIIQITNAILEEQEAFFRYSGKLKPCTMTQMSEKLSVSTSTISRAVKDKYLQFPAGCVLMKDLFSTSVPTSNGDRINSDGIKQFIRELVDEEDKEKPYSDLRLAELLKKKGYSLSRRVIAKYREEIGISGSFERKMKNEIKKGAD
ncbi:RNA polymerase factor sigma-54 [Lacrimispora saccharolytica]|uniref:RNA polymerase, sigma 54 subunit, RpoN n=1 Tax=Lacrimispora saccharolytica (strain ATCC 35040 / DSM 2544 / NRCC 2533 / WM1) TaxID=610130 RepID=D9QZD5_LACSW|nr:RNA polymerase factor sigma-54 [Lacrimispora saccharolytica]ADL04386.1 RNA polymerase, sigma 54 subunit, RpoN [[Clostridium] saccharolyticum WM1]QRV21347.1 RNA polymerase factor sigma-54 [Lacrimispora saccharolytica]